MRLEWRDEHGILRGYMSTKALDILPLTKHPTKPDRFVLTEDTCFNPPDIRIFLWKGETIKIVEDATKE